MDYELVSDKDWEEMVLKSDNAYFFSSPVWAKVIEETYGEYRAATRLYHVNGKLILVPMMEKNTHGKKAYGFKSYASMPDGWSGLFSESEITTDEFNQIVEDIIRHRHSYYMDLPPFENISPGKSVIKDEWKVKDEWNYMTILNVDQNYEKIWNNYHRRTRKAIRKAIKSGLETREATSLDDFRDFYKIWCKSSQKWGYDTPPHAFKFFRNLFEYGSPYVKLNLAIKDNQTVAGTITFHYTKTIYGYFGAFMSEYRTMNPTSLLYNDLIEQACETDCNYVNLGPSGNNENLRKYKEGFGAEEVEIERYLAVSKGAKMGTLILNKSKNLTDSLKGSI